MKRCRWCGVRLRWWQHRMCWRCFVLGGWWTPEASRWHEEPDSWPLTNRKDEGRRTMSKAMNDVALMRVLLREAASHDGVFETDAEPTLHPDGDKLVGLVTDDNGDGYRLTLEFIGEDDLIPLGVPDVRC